MTTFDFFFTPEIMYAISGGAFTYPSNVQCYNDDTGKWMTLDDAKAYGGTMNLYVYDGVVRIVEVKA